MFRVVSVYSSWLASVHILITSLRCLNEEESDGDTHLFGPGSSSLYGHVDDMYIVRLGRSSWLGYSGEGTNLLGLHRSSQLGSFNEQSFSSHSITPFQGDGI